jgi:hypothetical protein
VEFTHSKAVGGTQPTALPFVPVEDLVNPVVLRLAFEDVGSRLTAFGLVGLFALAGKGNGYRATGPLTFFQASILRMRKDWRTPKGSGETTQTGC